MARPTYPTVTLSNGLSIPSIGMGTGSPMHDFVKRDFGGSLLGKIARRACYNKYRMRWARQSREKKWQKGFLCALKCGYRLIDTSASYHCEHLVRQAIEQSNISREELFVTTRISNQEQWRSTARDSLMQSMDKLGVKYIDLFMFHWPVPDTYITVWKQMEELYNEGLVRSIGVANCHQHHLEALLAKADIVPMVNQFEVHPLMSQKPLIEYCKSKGIVVEGYTAIGRFHKKLATSPVLQIIGETHGKMISQIILKWHIQNGIIPIVRSSNPKRIMQNIDVFDFELTDKEMQAIDGINENLRLRYDPDNCDFTKL